MLDHLIINHTAHLDTGIKKTGVGAIAGGDGVGDNGNGLCVCVCVLFLTLVVALQSFFESADSAHHHRCSDNMMYISSDLVATGRNSHDGHGSGRACNLGEANQSQ